MSLTLQLDDAVAESLRREASAEKVPPEELANRLVREALEYRIAERRWQEQNHRRLELIAKKSRTPLAPDELEEFTQLQESVSARAVSFDRELRRSLDGVRREAEGLLTERTP